MAQATFDMSALNLSAGPILKSDDINALKPFIANLAASKCSIMGMNGSTAPSTNCN